MLYDSCEEMPPYALLFNKERENNKVGTLSGVTLSNVNGIFDGDPFPVTATATGAGLGVDDGDDEENRRTPTEISGTYAPALGGKCEDGQEADT